MKWSISLSSLLLSVFIVACAKQDVDSLDTSPIAKTSNADEIMLEDFSSANAMALVSSEHGTVSYVAASGAVAITLDSVAHHVSDFIIQPENAWDWSNEGYFALALDIQNPMPTSTHVYVSVKDKNGVVQVRSFGLKAHANGTYYFELNVPELELSTGIRSNPPSWKSDYTPIIWRGGSKKLDLSGIVSMKFDVRGVPDKKQFVIDNLRLLKPKQYDDEFLVGLVDEFGQSTRLEFVDKIHSVDELQKKSAAELQALRDTPLPGRSKFNGWKDGPKLEATGYFRTEKHQNRWSLVDPEGYLFFSTGIANIRMSNTTTMTGYDFDAELINQRAADDLTPEDSIGLNTAPKAAWPSRQVSSLLRAKMFTWLPSYDEPLGAHYGYRREVHSGAVDKGESYSFYRANLARKYASNDEAVYMKQWAKTTTDRMLSWGFTSFGNWVDPIFYHQDRLPYFANGWIIGDFKTVSSGNDYWAPLPDPFDPVFVERAEYTAKQIAAEVQDSPWCVGVFIDNEKSWGMMGSTASQFGIVINTLGRAMADSPTKAVFVATLKQKYSSIEALNKAWNTQIASWQALEDGLELAEFNDAMIADFAVLLEQYASEYFRIVKTSVSKYLPNHMYLGARFADWGMTPEIRAAAAKYSDVMSYNFYREVINEDVFFDFLKELDKPSLIGEFHNGALDSGLLNPGLVHAESQADRGRKYKEYVNSVLASPYLVGAHWFQYIDSPLTGRAYDGENYNVGFVSVTDIPYQPLVDAAKEINETLYQRIYKTAVKN